MSVEPDASLGWVEGACCGFPGIVQQHGEHEGQGNFFGKQAEHESGMGPDISFRVEFGWLAATFEGLHFGEDDAQQTGGIEEVESAQAVPVQEDAHEFIPYPFDADFGDGGCFGAEGGPGGGVHLVVEGGGEPYGAHEPQAVLAESLDGIADGPQHLRLEVCPSADVIDDISVCWIEKHSVDREVPALGVFLGSCEGHAFRAASVAVRAIGPERGDFEHGAAFVDHDDSEMGTDVLGPGKQLEDLRRGGIGGDVVIVRFPSEEFVTHAAACEVGDVARRLEPPCHFRRGRAQGCCIHHFSGHSADLPFVMASAMRDRARLRDRDGSMNAD